MNYPAILDRTDLPAVFRSVRNPKPITAHLQDPAFAKPHGWLRSPAEARAELQAKGISITQWAVANKFSPNLVFEVLGGRKKCVRGQAHEIAIKLGLKSGEICVDPARALERPRQRVAA